MSSVRSTYSGFVGLPGRAAVQIEAGREYPADHPAVTAAPDLFTAPTPPTPLPAPVAPDPVPEVVDEPAGDPVDDVDEDQADAAPSDQVDEAPAAPVDEPPAEPTPTRRRRSARRV